ncbi:MAG: archaellin/type IV pilin N-terminal domain-containing protein [Dehalococcoidia bacterium]
MFRTVTGGQSQRGITGLETAIILIAFVVVASVFAFTVLSTGIFASERSKETVYAGIEEAKSTLEPRGAVVAYKADRGGTDTIYKVSFIVSNAVAGEPIDLTPPYTADGTATDPDISSGAEYKTVISYADKNQYMGDVPWTVDWLGGENGDSLLEVGEKAEISVWLLIRDTTQAITSSTATSYWTADVNGANGILSTGTILDKNDKFTLTVGPPTGAVLTVERTLPSRLDAIMDLK